MHLINYYPHGPVKPYEPSGEPRWSVIVGTVACGSLYVPSFAIGLATGSREAFAMCFTGTFVFTFHVSVRTVCGVFRFLGRRRQWTTRG